MSKEPFMIEPNKTPKRFVGVCGLASLVAIVAILIAHPIHNVMYLGVTDSALHFVGLVVVPVISVILASVLTIDVYLELKETW